MEQEMFVYEAFQSLDMAFTNVLTGMRKTLWDAFSTKIADLKEKADQLRNECSESFEDLKVENNKLLKKLEVTEHVLQGKELEIYALRHQIRSLLSGRPVCNNCSQEIVAPDVNLLQSSLRFIDDRRPAPLSAVSVPRKRTLVNASLSSSTITAEPVEDVPPLQNTARSRPSQKRRCLSDLNNASDASRPHSTHLNKAQVLVAETQDLDSEVNPQAAHTQPVGPSVGDGGGDRNADDSENEPSSVQSAPTLTNASPAPTNPVRPDAALREPSKRLRMRLVSLSPPTQTSFDASEAIRKAVNHQDINDDVTVLHSRLHYRSSTVSVNRKDADGPHPPKHIHKPSCRYFSSKKKVQQKRERVPSEARKSDSDATGADLTLPTECLASEVTTDVDAGSEMNVFSATEAHQPPSKTRATNSETHKNAQVDEYEDLPSVGGSPSKNGAPNQPFQRNQRANYAEPNADNASTAFVQLSSRDDPAVVGVDKPPTDPPHYSKTPSAEKTSTPMNVLKPHPPSPAATMPSVPQKQTCNECFEYYRAVGYSEEEIQERLSRAGNKHNHLKDVTPSTPKGFWNLTLSSQPNTEQALPADNAAPSAGSDRGQEGRVRSLRRRRPLHFPGEVTPSPGPPSR
ncbi:hypothetical protein AAHC03_013958 [Spirometra sp. Aus1]